MGEVSAIYIQRGVPAGKQTSICLEYARREHISMTSIIPYYAMEQAVQMVKDGIVNVLIVAFDSRVARQLAVDVDGHGRVVFVHPVPTQIEIPRASSLPAVEELIVRWYRAGRTPHEIAEDLGGDTRDVAAVLRREGKYPGCSD